MGGQYVYKEQIEITLILSLILSTVKPVAILTISYLVLTSQFHVTALIYNYKEFITNVCAAGIYY